MNDLTKIIVAGLITIGLSIGGSLWSTGESTGKYQEKVQQLEIRMDKSERAYASDHDLLLRIDSKLTSVTELLKQIQEDRKNLK